MNCSQTLLLKRVLFDCLMLWTHLPFTLFLVFSLLFFFLVGMIIVVHLISGFHIPCSSTFSGKYSGDDWISIEHI